MIGTIFEKPLSGLEAYAQVAKWCTESQSATIADMGDYYEVVAIPEPSTEERAEIDAMQRNSTEARLADIEEALMELASIIAGE